MEFISPLLSGILAFAITFSITPKLIQKMKVRGMVGVDVNKKDKKEIPEMGGIAAVVGFVVALVVVLGIERIRSTGGMVNPNVVLGVLGVLFISAFVGLIDDICFLSPKIKVALVAFAAIPLVIVHIGSNQVRLPFGLEITFPFLLYWLIIVPFAITAAANAINLSGGYNGLETGEIAVMSGFLLIISIIRNSSFSTLLISSGLLGASIGLYYYNRFPAKIFVGDVGTLSMGAMIGVVAVIGNLQLYGLILVLPMFFDLSTRVYYGLKHVDEKKAVKNPVILEDGKLKTPEGAKWYTLPYFILSKRPMKEKELVNRMLMIYATCGFIALILSFL